VRTTGLALLDELQGRQSADSGGSRTFVSFVSTPPKEKNLTFSVADHALRLVDQALEAGAISRSEADQARESIHAHRSDTGYVKEWLLLLVWCMKATDPVQAH